MFDKTITINKDIILDYDLSHGAYRLYCYLLMNSDKTMIRNKDIQNNLKIKTSYSLSKFFKELIERKYISRYLKTCNNSLIGGFDYIIYNEPKNCEKGTITDTKLLSTNTDHFTLNFSAEIVNNLFQSVYPILNHKKVINLTDWQSSIILAYEKDKHSILNIQKCIPFAPVYSVKNGLQFRKKISTILNDLKNKKD